MNENVVGFQQFLKELNGYYVGVNQRWLRMLLFGIIPIGSLEKSALELFNQLTARGFISKTDVKLLSDIAEVTKMASATKRIDTYKNSIQSNDTAGAGLTAYRRAMFNVLANTDKDDLMMVIGFYKLSAYNYNNMWDVVYHIEKDGRLNSQDDCDTFAKLINQHAQSFLEETPYEPIQDSAQALELIPVIGPAQVPVSKPAPTSALIPAPTSASIPTPTSAEMPAVCDAFIIATGDLYWEKRLYKQLEKRGYRCYKKGKTFCNFVIANSQYDDEVYVVKVCTSIGDELIPVPIEDGDPLKKLQKNRRFCKYSEDEELLCDYILTDVQNLKFNTTASTLKRRQNTKESEASTRALSTIMESEASTSKGALRTMESDECDVYIESDDTTWEKTVIEKLQRMNPVIKCLSRTYWNPSCDRIDSSIQLADKCKKILVGVLPTQQTGYPLTLARILYNEHLESMRDEDKNKLILVRIKKESVIPRKFQAMLSIDFWDQNFYSRILDLINNKEVIEVKTKSLNKELDRGLDNQCRKKRSGLTTYFWSCFSMSFLSSQKDSVIFYLIVNDVDNLKRLWCLHVNKKLVDDLAAILEYAVNDLETFIDESEYLRVFEKLNAKEMTLKRTFNIDERKAKKRPPGSGSLKEGIDSGSKNESETKSKKQMKMPFDTEFQGLLADVSEIYTGEKLFWLRLLLYDHCSGALLSRRNVTGHDLFNELKTRGFISYDPNDASCTDVEILVDIAEVTQDEGALQIIQKFKEKHKNNNSNYNFRKDKPISEYRKHLFQVLQSNTTDLLAKMPGHYDLNPTDFNNKWDLAFKVEGSKFLEEGNIEKMKHFAKLLDEDAKRIFLQTGKAPAKASAQYTTHTPARTIGQALTQTTAQVTQASAKQTQASAQAAAAAKGKYNTIMVVFSKWYGDRGWLDMLKCVFKDLLTMDILSGAKTGMDLLQALHGAGYLGPNNITLLNDTIIVTNQSALRKSLSEILPSFPNEETVSPLLSPHRQRIVAITFQLHESDRDDIDQYFNNPVKKQYSNRWSMIVDLESRQKIKKRKSNTFIEELKEIGIDYITETSASTLKKTSTISEKSDNDDADSDNKQSTSTRKTKKKSVSSSKRTRKRKKSTTSEESDEEENSVPYSKRTRKRKKPTTSEESDEEENSGYSDCDNRPSTSKHIRKKGASRKRKPGKKSKDGKKQIMISYNHTHDVTVRHIYEELKKKLKSHKIWIDFVGITGLLADDIEKGIKESNIVLICLSENYEKSDNCKFECRKIQELKKPFIPLKMQKYKPEENSKVQQLVRGKSRLYIDFTNNMEFNANIKKLIKCIKKEQAK